MSASVEQLLRQGRRMIVNRSTWDAHVAEVYKNFLPTHAVTVTGGGSPQFPGQRVDNYIVNNTPVWALDMGAAALFSYLTTPNTYWLLARAEDDRLNMDPEVRRWLYDTRNFIFSLITSSRSRFYAQLDPFYHDLMGPGTAAMFSEVLATRYRAQYRPIHEFYPMENEDGVIDQTFRRYQWPRYLAVQKFGRLDILEPDSDQEDMLEFIQYVGPDEENGDFMDLHWYKDEHIFSGFFDTFPFSIGRYAKEWSGDFEQALGRGQGMAALGDAKMLQKQEKIVLRGGQKAVDPTVLTNSKMKGNVAANPGTFLSLQGGLLGRTIAQPIQPGDHRFGLEEVKRTEDRIIRAMGVDVFLNLLMRGNSSPLKAAEAMGRRDEAFRSRGALVLGLSQDVLSSLAMRIYRAGRMRGFIEDPPRKLRLSNGGVSFEFSSPLALAQRSQEVEAYMSWLGSVAPLIEMNPQNGQALNANYTMQRHAMLFDLDPEHLVPPEALEQERQLAAQAEQMAQLAPALKDAGSAAKDFAQAGVQI